MHKSTKSPFCSIQIEKACSFIPLVNSGYIKINIKTNVMSVVAKVNSCHQPLRFVSCKRRAETAKLGMSKAREYTEFKKPRFTPVTPFIAKTINPNSV